nr:hypothetical protein OH826_20100 [Streptomyces sp. NBC_00899]
MALTTWPSIRSTGQPGHRSEVEDQIGLVGQRTAHRLVKQVGATTSRPLLPLAAVRTGDLWVCRRHDNPVVRDAPVMTRVVRQLVEDQVDISALNCWFAEVPVSSASAELVRGSFGDLDGLGETLREVFADGASWCRVDLAVHTVTGDEAEVRLVPRSDEPTWHADYFHAGWRSTAGARIPPEFRPQYAAYVDRRHETRESCLLGEDLRAVAAADGAGGVDKVVRHHCAQLAQWYDALDRLLLSARTGAGLPEWATSTAKDELLDWHRTREYLTSAVLEYHHDDNGPRPETVWGNLNFHFSTGSVELVPDF